MKYEGFLIAAVMLLAAHQCAADVITLDWKLGGKPGPYSNSTSPIILCPGDVLNVTWMGSIPHNVLRTNNTAAVTADTTAGTICDKTVGTVVAPTDTMGNYTLDADTMAPATFGIYCSVGGHCVGGMNAVIEVRASCNETDTDGDRDGPDGMDMDSGDGPDAMDMDSMPASSPAALPGSSSSGSMPSSGRRLKAF